jgi:hypothetical protein
MQALTLLIIASFFTAYTFGQQVYDTIGTFQLDGNTASKKTYVVRNRSNNICLFKADFDLDPDGSPRAYNEANTGLLHNDNGRNKNTGVWFAVVTSDPQKKIPVKQGPNDPCPGNYISTTSLELSNHAKTDYRRYVDPDSVTFFVLPGGSKGARKMNINLGDIGFVYNKTNKQAAWAIFADIGPAAIVGEGSMDLARKLGITVRIDSKGRVRGGVDTPDIVYICFPSSGKVKYEKLDNELIKELGMKAIEKLGLTINDLKTMAEKL